MSFHQLRRPLAESQRVCTFSRITFCPLGKLWLSACPECPLQTLWSFDVFEITFSESIWKAPCRLPGSKIIHDLSEIIFSVSYANCGSLLSGSLAESCTSMVFPKSSSVCKGIWITPPTHQAICNSLSLLNCYSNCFSVPQCNCCLEVLGLSIPKFSSPWLPSSCSTFSVVLRAVGSSATVAKQPLPEGRSWSWGS